MPEGLQPHVVIEDIRVQPLLNAADVARILKVSKTTAYRIFDSGEIKTVELGRAVRVTVDALEEYIELKTINPHPTSPERERILG